LSAEILAYVPDLMDRSRIQAAAGDHVVFVPRPDDLDAAVDDSTALVVVDVARAGAIQAVEAIADRVRVVAFGPHVDDDVLEQATAAGCAEVLPRSVFFARLDKGLLLRG
jgi:hypothetical protein